MTEFEGSLAAPYIEALARQAGVEATAAAINGLLRWCIPNPYHVRPENAALYSPAAVAAIVQKAVEAEREACARVCDNLITHSYGPDWDAGTLDCAAAIRARG